MSKNKILSFEELGDDLCYYCPLHESEKGVHCYGNYPIYCVDSGCCEKAYQNYIDFMEGKIKDLNLEIENQIKERELELCKYEDLHDLSNKRNNKLKRRLSLLNSEIQQKFKGKEQLIKAQIKFLKDKVISHESAKLFNEFFGEMAKRDGADISIVTNDILEGKSIENIKDKIKQLESEYKALVVEEDNYYKENKEIISKEIDEWYQQESGKIRRKYE